MLSRPTRPTLGKAFGTGRWVAGDGGRDGSSTRGTTGIGVGARASTSVSARTIVRVGRDKVKGGRVRCGRRYGCHLIRSLKGVCEHIWLILHDDRNSVAIS
jgi:hypothetical protein